jgi:hypothetical protein
MNTTTNTAPEREEIEQLLPWHAAGTLSRRDAQRVEEALKRDPELARQFALVREEFAETIHLNETLGAPSARAMERLMAGIEAESGPARAVQPRFSFSTWLSERLTAFSPRTLAYAAGAAMLAIVLQFGALTGIAINTAMGPSGQYGTASGPTAPAAAGSYVLIAFRPDVPMSQINGVLEKHKLKIVDGPASGSGVYRVRISDSKLSEAERDQIIERVRAETGVVMFVAPAAE